MGKLEQLINSEGQSIEQILADSIDGVCIGMCTNEGCDYTAIVEPDQAHGYCDICGTKTVASALILAGMI